MEYTSLGKSGLKISKIILGCMQYGQSEDLKWALPEEQALPVIKHAFDKGINTWDTVGYLTGRRGKITDLLKADVYSMGDSERIVGAALKRYNIHRDRVVILSKCYGGVLSPEELASLSAQEKLMAMSVNDGSIMVNRVGLSRKHIFDAVEASVARLGTYIDVLQIHRLDRETPRVEIMRALNDVIESGKVHYIGASSMATWEFHELNSIAEKNSWHTFISMQDYHSLLHREEEREMFPYCRDAGISIIPWSPLARGWLARPLEVSQSQPTQRQGSDPYSEWLIGSITKEDKEIITRVEKLSKEKGVSMAQISTAWSLMKGVYPILGLSSTKRVDEAAAVVGLVKGGILTDEDVKFLEEAYIPKSTVGW